MRALPASVAPLVFWLLLAAVSAAIGPDLLKAQPRERLQSPEDADPVFANGRPGELVTVGVPVPAIGPSVAYRVVPEGSTRILGALQGTVPETNRHLMLTLMLTGTARAGETDVALVSFRSEAGAVRRVPVRLRVPHVRDLALRFANRTLTLILGSRGELSFAVRNAGNARDTATVRVEGPDSWNVQAAPSRFVLDPGEEQAGTLSVRTAVGSTRQPVVAWIEGRPDTLQVPLIVLNEPPGRGGPDISSRLSVGDAVGTPEALLEGQVSGSVGRGVYVQARAGYLQETLGGEGAGASRAELYALPPMLQVYGNDFSVGAGRSSQRLSPLTGVSFAGTGGRANVKLGRLEPAGFYIRDDLRNTAGYGGRLGLRVGDAAMAASGVRLPGRSEIQPGLDALGYAYSMPLYGTTLHGEVAARSFGDESGAGLYARWERQAGRLQWSLRGGHAPGGARALARAENEAAASASYRLTESLRIGGNGWYNDDGSGSAGARSSRGGRGQATVRPWRPVSVSLSAYRFGYASTSVLGRRETREVGADARLALRAGPARLSGFARLSERTLVGGTSPDPPRADQTKLASYGARASLPTRLGSLQLSGRITENEAGSGLPGRQGRLSVSASDVPLFRWGPLDLRGQGAWTRTTTFDTYPAIDLFRGGLSLDGPADTRLSVTGVRDPFTASSRSPWIVTVRIQKGLSLPPLLRSGVRGLVFEDRDGDGRRGDGEPGVAGVRVELGGESTATDAKGRYTLSSRFDDGVPELDVTTFPEGWVAGSVESDGRTHRFALTPVAPVHVRLRLSTSLTAQSMAGELRRVRVYAHREDGRQWRARHLGSGKVTFSALPPGDYTLSLDTRACTEPLTVVGTLPTFSVGDGPTPKLDVVLRGRVINIRTKPTGSRAPGPRGKQPSPASPQTASASRRRSTDPGRSLFPSGLAPSFRSR